MRKRMKVVLAVFTLEVGGGHAGILPPNALPHEAHRGATTNNSTRRLDSGVKHFRVHGKGSKIRYVPVHPAALDRIDAYTAAAGHALDLEGALFRPTKVAAGAIIEKAIAYRSVYDVIKRYAVAANIPVAEFCVHSLRATAATNALDNGSDIAKVQEWLGHANVSTTRLYDKRKTRAEDSPTFKVAY